MSSFVERAGSGKTKCQVCGEAIAKGALRTVDETVYYVQDEERSKRTYCHLGCAVEMQRHHAHAALVGRQTTDELYAMAIVEVGRIDPKLVDETHPHRQPTIAHRAVPLSDPLTGDLLAELEASPDNRDLLTVLADQLQRRGDERGELIMLDLDAATAGAEVKLTAIKRRRELSLALTPALGPTDRGTWGYGFFRKLKIRFTTQDALAAVLVHPSCRLLCSLEIEQARTIELSGLPRTLRSIRVHGRLGDDSNLTSLPYLEELRIGGFSSLAHPTLPSLELEHASRTTLDALDPGNLPALRHLSLVDHSGDDAITLLARSGWLARLTRLELRHIVFQLHELDLLENALDGRRLERLSVIGTLITVDEVPRLEALCDELEFKASGYTPPSTATIYIEHANKPEWGRGTLVREYDGKVDVKFESGTRTFKADAPFLKRS